MGSMIECSLTLAILGVFVMSPSCTPLPQPGGDELIDVHEFQYDQATAWRTRP